MKNNLVKLLGVAVVSSCLSACTSAGSDIQTVLSSEQRDIKQAARDSYRHPAETLAFFEVEPDMHVVEIWPGGGWYADILVPLLREKGQYYAAHFFVDADAPKYFVNSREKFQNKVDSDPGFANVKMTSFHPTKEVKIAPDGSADRVLTFRNVHNWYMSSNDAGVEGAFKAFYKALKPGGILGVVDHRMPESFDMQEKKRSGYVKQSYVIKMAEKAGFKLVAKSEINANPKDTADHPRGVWTLPPRLALGDEDKAKYQAIGESDRMTLKFVKP